MKRSHLAFLLALLGHPWSAEAVDWVPGNVAVAIGDGCYQIWEITLSGGGTIRETVCNAFGGQTNGCAFSPDQSQLYTTDTVFSKVVIYERTGTHAQTEVDTDVDCDNGHSESIAFERNDPPLHWYVGNAGGCRDIVEYDENNNFVPPPDDVVVENVGADWIDLAFNDAIMFYTSEGPTIFKYDVALDRQLANFATLTSPLGGDKGFALKLLPPSYNGDDGLVVTHEFAVEPPPGSGPGPISSTEADIKRLNGDGSERQTYDVPGRDGWFGLNLDVGVNVPPLSNAGGPYFAECSGGVGVLSLNGMNSTDPPSSDPTKFWAADIGTSSFYRFDLETGAAEGPFNTGTGAATVGGICVVGNDGAPLTYSWLTMTCAGGMFTDPSSPTPTLTVDGPDGCSVTCDVHLTVTDLPGASHTASGTVTVNDSTAPSVLASPDDFIQVDCQEPLGELLPFDDACDGILTAEPTDVRPPPECPHRYFVERTWEVTDGCFVARDDQLIEVRDDDGPVADNPPPDITVDCVPPLPGPPLSFLDNCGEVYVDTTPEDVGSPACPSYVIARTWQVVDSCGNPGIYTQFITVKDDPPVVVGPGERLECLWPPKHKYACFEDLSQNWDVSDTCTPNPTIAITGVSSQCDDAPCAAHPGENGDGNTVNDLVYNPGADRLCARAERAGNRPEGRNYTVTLTATDGCGQAASDDTTVYVPHDQNPREDCLRPPNGPSCCQ